MVIRLVSVSDQMELPQLHNIFRAILGWDGDLGYIIRVHGQEFNSCRRETQSKTMREFKLHRQEKFYTSAICCTCGNGTFVSSTFRMASTATKCSSVWEGTALRHPNIAGARPDNQRTGDESV
jgi:hypothetical protein